MSVAQWLAAGLVLGLAADGFRTRTKLGARQQVKPEAPPQLGGRGLPGGGPDTFPACHLASSDCSIKDMTQATLVYTDSDTSRCFNGDPWAFLVHPGATDKLLYYFPGGGACWEQPSFLLPGAATLCMDSLKAGLGAAGYGLGVQNLDHPRSPFKDYTIVSPTYCAGGTHVANTTAESLLGGTKYQYDYNNNEFARSWAIKNLDRRLESFVIMGSSAGALGTVVWADLMLSSFRYRKASVLFDCYMGVFPRTPKKTLGLLLKGFGSCNLPIMDAFRESCEAETFEMEDLLEYTVSKYPKVAFGHMQPKTDIIQRLFYSAVGLSFLGNEVIITSNRFYSTANAMMQRFNKYPNYVAYLVSTSYHTFTPADIFYTTTVSGEKKAGPPGTPPLAEWIGKVVAHEEANSECEGPLESNGHRGESYCDRELFPKTLST